MRSTPARPVVDLAERTRRALDSPAGFCHSLRRRDGRSLAGWARDGARDPLGAWLIHVVPLADAVVGTEYLTALLRPTDAVWQAFPLPDWVRVYLRRLDATGRRPVVVAETARVLVDALKECDRWQAVKDQLRYG